MKVLVVDDEAPARQRLIRLLSELDGAYELAGEAADGIDAVEQCRSKPIDVVLLDVQMPGMSGLDAAREMAQLQPPPAVILVTAFEQYALAAFEHKVEDYLVKPVRRERLQAALLRVAQRRAAEPVASTGPVLVVSDRGRVLRVPVVEVLYLKAELKYVTLCSTHGNWLLDESLAELEPRLGEGFVRVHRNAVVARSAVRALTRPSTGDGDEGWQVQLVNGDTLAVSRRQLPAVRDVLADARDT